jgi:hypothetical protein
MHQSARLSKSDALSSSPNLIKNQAKSVALLMSSCASTGVWRSHRLRRTDDHARHLAVRTGAAEPFLERHLMIAPGASSSPCSASVAMGVGAPTLGSSHKGGRSQAGDERHSNLTDGTRHPDSALYRGVLRRHRIRAIIPIAPVLPVAPFNPACNEVRQPIRPLRRAPTSQKPQILWRNPQTYT